MRVEASGSGKSTIVEAVAVAYGLSPEGLRETSWEDLDVVDHWRRFLDTPQAYLRHLVD